MKVKFTQQQPFGCGLYALANLLDFHEALATDRLEESEKGCTIDFMNRVLRAEGSHMYVDTLFFDVMGSKVPSNITDIGPQEVGHIMPVLIEYQSSPDSIRHMVAGYINHDRKLLVMDSCREEIIETTLTDYQANKTVYGFYSLCNRENVCWQLLEKPSVDEYLNTLN